MRPRWPWALVAGAALVAGTLTGCGQLSPKCYPTSEAVLADIAAQAPGLEPIVAFGVSGPESDGFFYIAMRFSLGDGIREGVWGMSTWDEIIATDEVANEVSNWPTRLDDDHEAGTHSRSQAAALRCLRGRSRLIEMDRAGASGSPDPCPEWR